MELLQTSLLLHSELTPDEAGRRRSHSTDPEPFKRNVLFSVRDVLSSLLCFSFSWCLLLNLIWPQCNRPQCSSFSAPHLANSFKFGDTYEPLTLYLFHFKDFCTLYLDAYTRSSAYVHFNLKSGLVAMETWTNGLFAGNNGVAFCTICFIALQTSKWYFSTLHHMTQVCGYFKSFMFSFTPFVIFAFPFFKLLLVSGSTPFRTCPHAPLSCR